MLRCIGLAVVLGCSLLWAQTPPQVSTPPPTLQQAKEPAKPSDAVHPAAALYRRLGDLKLDPARLYRIRDAHLNREDLHLSFDRGVIVFAHAVDGRVTGAYFRGEGQVLLSPPDRVERASLGLFTGAAILSQGFTTAYLRFNDDTLAELEPSLRPFQPLPPLESETAEDAADLSPEPEAAPIDPQTVIQQGDSVFAALAPVSALRLLATFLNAETQLPDGSMGWQQPPNDRCLHVRLAGTKLGVFDLFFDSRISEQIAVAQSTTRDDKQFYDLWTTFPMRSARAQVTATRAGAPPTFTAQTQAAAEKITTVAKILRCRIQARVQPPHTLSAEATLDLQASEAGNRLVIFELSRFLKVKEVTADGYPLEFLQNEALEGSSLARRGNDLVAVVFPAPLAKGQSGRLRFVYSGGVMSEAGGGLLYVGARGIWYPNLGLAMSEFDLQFRYPAGWTLLATGKRLAQPAEVPGGDGTPELEVHYVTERPIPLAGFNLGRYLKAEAEIDGVQVEGYAANNVEDSARPPMQLPQVIPTDPYRPGSNIQLPLVKTPPPSPRPSAHVQEVADSVAATIQFLSRRLGPFPYGGLAITQIPGKSSQGWPGLMYLSSMAFLSPEERANLHADPFEELTYGRLMPAHETAHQWWGDLLLWNSYREQWLVEALSNYCALLAMEERDPQALRLVLDRYRQDLLQKNKAGQLIGDAGPVTLGVRLNSSRFPDAYETIAYERGTWLFHMLRSLLLDARESPVPAPAPRRAGTAAKGKGKPAGVSSYPGGIPAANSNARPAGESGANDPFFAVLRSLREHFEGGDISTRDVQQAFEEALPESIRYEGRKSLEWFFDGWVNGTAVPALALDDVRMARQGSALLASGKVLQKHAPFDLITSVPLYADVPGQKPVLLGRVFADGAETPFRLPVPPGTRRLLLDPFGTVLTRP